MQNDDTSLVPVLPNLCKPTSILSLVLIGELVSWVLVLADSYKGFSWQQLGLISLITQWIILCCALFLCHCRPWLNKLKPIYSGMTSYCTCLFISAIILAIAQKTSAITFDWEAWLKAWLISAILSGILLRYLYLQQQLINQQQAELQSRFQALQSRIRPHFLFNSMNTIASLIGINPVAAEKAVEDLSSLFRSSLQAPSLVKLEDELDLCQRYIAIEHQRLGDRLSMKWDIDPSLGSIKVPSLFLQPLLENAIVHGVQNMMSGGKIVFCSIKENHNAIFIITNTLSSVNTGNRQVDSGNKIALDNIKNRLYLYFNDSAKVTINKNNEHYTVRIVIPISY